jgi:phytol kinase
MAISWFDIELVVLVYIIVFLIIAISEYCRRRLNLGPLTTRHAIHLFAGMALFFLPFFSDWYYPFLVPLGIGALTGTAFMFKKGSFITTSMVDEKKYSRAHAFGPVYYIISIGILVASAWNFRHIVIASIMIMAWGDGGAATFAPMLRRRHRYPNSEKTVEGSIIMFILSYLGALLAYAVSIQSGILSVDMLTLALTCLVGAFVGTIVEAVTVGLVKPFDNFTVPFSSAIAMYVFSLLH